MPSDFEDEAAGVGGIMRDGEGRDGDVADGEVSAGVEVLDGWKEGWGRVWPWLWERRLRRRRSLRPRVRWGCRGPARLRAGEMLSPDLWRRSD